MSYRRRLFIMKIMLPLFGAVALALALWIDWNDDAVVSEQFSDRDKDFAENKMAANAPEIDIETDKGDRYKVSAQKVESLNNEVEQFSGGDIAMEMVVDGTEIKVSAQKVKMQREENLAIFENDVYGEIDAQTKISSDKLIADIEKRELSSDEFVRVEKANSFVEADSFRLTGPEDNRQIIFNGNVSGELFTSDEATKKIESDQNQEGNSP